LLELEEQTSEVSVTADRPAYDGAAGSRWWRHTSTTAHTNTTSNQLPPPLTSYCSLGLILVPTREAPPAVRWGSCLRCSILLVLTE